MTKPNRGKALKPKIKPPKLLPTIPAPPPVPVKPPKRYKSVTIANVFELISLLVLLWAWKAGKMQDDARDVRAEFTVARTTALTFDNKGDELQKSAEDTWLQFTKDTASDVLKLLIVDRTYKYLANLMELQGTIYQINSYDKKRYSEARYRQDVTDLLKMKQDLDEDYRLKNDNLDKTVVVMQTLYGFARREMKPDIEKQKLNIPKIDRILEREVKAKGKTADFIYIAGILIGVSAFAFHIRSSIKEK